MATRLSTSVIALAAPDHVADPKLILAGQTLWPDVNWAGVN